MTLNARVIILSHLDEGLAQRGGVAVLQRKLEVVVRDGQPIEHLLQSPKRAIVSNRETAIMSQYISTGHPKISNQRRNSIKGTGTRGARMHEQNHSEKPLLPFGKWHTKTKIKIKTHAFKVTHTCTNSVGGSEGQAGASRHPRGCPKPCRRANTLLCSRGTAWCGVTYDWDLVGVDVDGVHLLPDAAERGLHAQLGEIGSHKPVRVLGDLT